jgi:hypothetical protein
MFKQRLASVLFIVSFGGLAVGSIPLLSPFATVSGSLGHNFEAPQPKVASLNQTQAAVLNDLVIFYSDKVENRLFVKSPNSNSSPVEVLAYPQFRQFEGWDWSDQAGAFVVVGIYGLYIYKPGDLLPQLFLDTNSVGYLSVGSASWLPDGKSILFAATNLKTNQQDNMWSLMVDMPGQPPKLLLGPVSADNAFLIYDVPRWSPDGKFIAFTATGIQGHSIELFPVDCAATNTLSCLKPLSVSDGSFYNPPSSPTDYGEGYDNPNWSPDGKRLAFNCSFSGICVLNYSNGTFTHFRRLNTKCHGQFAWSPDSNYFVCSSIAYEGANRNGPIEIVNVVANTSDMVATVADGSYEQVFDWIPVKELSVLQNVATPVPSPTMSQKLGLEAICHATPGTWAWRITNPNPDSVPFVLNLYDIFGGQEIYRDEIPAAQNGVPTTLSFETPNYPKSNSMDQTIVRLWVDKVEQARVFPSDAVCATGTPDPRAATQAAH